MENRKKDPRNNPNHPRHLDFMAEVDDNSQQYIYDSSNNRSRIPNSREDPKHPDHNKFIDKN